MDTLKVDGGAGTGDGQTEGICGGGGLAGTVDGVGESDRQNGEKERNRGGCELHFADLK